MQTIDWEDGFWRPYVWGLRALVLGAIELALGMALLTASPLRNGTLGPAVASPWQIWTVTLLLSPTLLAIHKGPLRLLRVGGRRIRQRYFPEKARALPRSVRSKDSDLPA